MGCRDGFVMIGILFLNRRVLISFFSRWGAGGSPGSMRFLSLLKQLDNDPAGCFPTVRGFDVASRLAIVGVVMRNAQRVGCTEYAK